jgi:hypothetical protein
MHYVPTLDAHLRSTTSLTPTYHKSGGLKAVIGIAVAIAIPFAAPAIATAIGTSMGISMAAGSFALTAGSAMVGAGIGALSSYALGGNPLIGALGGAVGGGIGGYNYTPSSAASAVGGGFSPDAAAGEFGVSAAGGGVQSAGTAGLTSQAPGAIPGGSAGDFAGVTFGGDAAANNAAYLDIGNALSGATGSESMGISVNTPTGVDATQGYYSGSATAEPSFGTGYGEMVTDSPMGAANVTQSQIPRAGVGVSALRPEPLLQQRITAGLSNLGDNLSDAAGTAWDNVTSPKFLAEQGLKVGTQMIGNVITSPDMSDREAALLDEQAAARQQIAAQAAQQREFKEGAAKDLYRQAAGFDPNYFGAQEAANIQNRRTREEEAALRRINPRDAGLREAERRRQELNTTRAVGSAQARGYQTGLANQANLTNRAAGLYPGANTEYATQVQTGLKDASTLYNRLQAERTAAGNLFGQIGKDVIGSTTEAEKKRKEEGPYA